MQILPNKMLMLQFLSVSYHSNNTKVSKTAWEWFRRHSDIDSVTTDQVRIRGHLNAQFVKKCI